MLQGKLFSSVISFTTRVLLISENKNNNNNNLIRIETPDGVFNLLPLLQLYATLYQVIVTGKCDRKM